MLGAYRTASARLQPVPVFLWRASSCPLSRPDIVHRGKREDGTYRGPLHAGRLVAGDRRKERLFQRKGCSCACSPEWGADARPWRNGAVEAEDFHTCRCLPIRIGQYGTGRYGDRRTTCPRVGHCGFPSDGGHLTDDTSTDD